MDYEITANAGVNESILGRLAALPVNTRFTPAIEETVVVNGRGSTTLYGIDTIAGAAGGSETVFDPEKLEASAVISNDLAARFHLRQGDTIELRGGDSTARFTIRTIAPKQNTGWIGIDIAAAQRLLGMYGKLDRIEVFLGAGEDAAKVERLVKANIPETWELETPGARSEENRRMLRAFRWNLRILSYISLLVGAFLIYNTIAVSVVRRRTEIGILRALGARVRAASCWSSSARPRCSGSSGRLSASSSARFSPPASARLALRYRQRAVRHQRARRDHAGAVARSPAHSS